MAVLKKIGLALLILIMIAAAAGVAFVIDFNRYARTPRQLEHTEKTVIIAGGDSFNTAVFRLKEAGVIAHPLKFKILARLQGDDKRIKAGEYAFSGNLSPRQVLAKLVKGEVKLYKLTVPEGYNLYQVSEVVQASDLGEAADFLKQASNPALAASLKIDADTVEGYLFPDTYFFPRDAGNRAIITTMVNRFHTVFSPQWRARAAEIGFSIHAVVTLASIIEKETGAGNERELISSVFHNRLAKGMRLEADPTVIYGLKEFDGNLTRKHLQTPSPYNTYTIKGLPYGPIANPGKAALQAALYPAQSEYLFFVAKRDGTHQFSVNLRDHNAAVRKYQLQR